MKTASGCSMILLAILLLTSSPKQVESGPIAANICFAGCNVALGACTSCGIYTAVITTGLAAPAASSICTVAYTACCGACTAATFAPTP